MEQPVLMPQVDGSPYQWFGEYCSYLTVIIDDATSDIHAEFFPSNERLYESHEGIYRKTWAV